MIPLADAASLSLVSAMVIRPLVRHYAKMGYRPLFRHNTVLVKDWLTEYHSLA